MSTIMYLNFNGEAEQAIQFYLEALQAKEVKMVRFGDIPSDPNFPLPENEQHMIMESLIEYAGGKIMMSDVLPSMKQMMGEVVSGNNVMISLVFADKQKVTEYYNNLAVGGKVIMPLSSMPWSTCFGILEDKFGVRWKFNSDAENFLNQVISNKRS